MTTNGFGRQEKTVEIDVWSDVMCPFCYLGDAALARALESFPHRDAVAIRYHSYQLMPELPADETVDLTQLLTARRGVSREQARAMNEQVAARGQALGLDYRFDDAQTINTRRAHRLIQHAAQTGRQHEIVVRLFQAYFTDGLNVGDRDVLVTLATEVGLDADAAREALDDAELDRVVDADIRRAQEMGISGVPFFVIDDRYGVSGAQPVEQFGAVLEQIWSERTAAR